MIITLKYFDLLLDHDLFNQDNSFKRDLIQKYFYLEDSIYSADSSSNVFSIKNETKSMSNLDIKSLVKVDNSILQNEIEIINLNHRLDSGIRFENSSE